MPIEEQVALALNRRSDLPAQDAVTVVAQILGAAVAAGAYGELLRLTADVRAEQSTSQPVYKQVLQEWAAARGLVAPRYELVGESGPAHDKTWEVRVYVGQFVSPPGTGATKRPPRARRRRNCSRRMRRIGCAFDPRRGSAVTSRRSAS